MAAQIQHIATVYFIFNFLSSNFLLPKSIFSNRLKSQIAIQKATSNKSVSVGVEEILDDELFQFLSTHLSSSVLVHDLNVRCDVSCCWLELFVHGPVTINEPLCHFDWFANSVSVAVVSFDDFPEVSLKNTWRDSCILLWKRGHRFQREYDWFRSLCWWLDFGRTEWGSRNSACKKCFCFKFSNSNLYKV